MHGSMMIAFNKPKIPMNSILWISCHLKISQGLPLVVQGFRSGTSIAGGAGSISGWGIKILHAVWWASQVALVVKNSPARAGDLRDIGLIPETGRSLGGEHGNPLQYSCLQNPMDRRAY